jgi:hypothetical protein
MNVNMFRLDSTEMLATYLLLLWSVTWSTMQEISLNEAGR